MVDVFRAVREILSDDGVLWLNIADSYTSGNRKWHAPDCRTKERDMDCRPAGSRDLPPKSLLGIPWRVAFALQDDGWILRQDIIWQKPAPIPESVRDRCTRAHEYLFMFVKQPRYYWDHSAMQEPASGRGPGNHSHKYVAAYDSGAVEMRTKAGLLAYSERIRESGAPATRNRRDVLTIGPEPYGGAHFAVMPTALVSPCVLASSRPGDVVLDPFMGSGTVAQVAQDLGRRWIGCEMREEYIALQAERTRQAALVL